jgi:hypothetical protein
MLTKLVALLTKSDTGHDNIALPSVTVTSATKGNTLELQKQTPNVRLHKGVSSRRNLFTSMEELNTSLVPQHVKVRSNKRCIIICVVIKAFPELK